jgi:hypothetical protein
MDSSTRMLDGRMERLDGGLDGWRREFTVDGCTDGRIIRRIDGCWMLDGQDGWRGWTDRADEWSFSRDHEAITPSSSVRLSGSVRQCAAVCGTARGSVRQCDE